MDPQFKASFIPKKPIVAPKGGIGTPSSINLFSVIAITIFLVGVVLSAGVFFYSRLLDNQIVMEKQSLDRAKDAFEPELIEQIVRMDSRIETSKKLIASHTILSPFFNLLSNLTLRSIRFKDFLFSYSAADNIKVEMKGEAESYTAIALEADLFGSQKYLKDTVVSDLALEPNGNVSFKIMSKIDKNLVSYSEAVKSRPTEDILSPEELDTADTTVQP